MECEMTSHLLRGCQEWRRKVGELTGELVEERKWSTAWNSRIGSVV
jgi:hypothetical protein